MCKNTFHLLYFLIPVWLLPMYVLLLICALSVLAALTRLFLLQDQYHIYPATYILIHVLFLKETINIGLIGYMSAHCI